MQTKPIEILPNILIHFSRQQVVVAICHNGCVQLQRSINHRDAGAQLIATLEEMLVQYKKPGDIKHFKYLAASCGPGPFTTLRTIIATVNGLAYATGIPLVGLNVIEIFTAAHHNSHYTYTLALLHAFGKEVYYAKYDGHNMSSGCCSLDTWIHNVQELHCQNPDLSIQLIGQGVEYFQQMLIERNILPSSYISVAHLYEPDIDCIAKAAYNLWTKEDYVPALQLSPIYGKPPIS